MLVGQRVAWHTRASTKSLHTYPSHGQHAMNSYLRKGQLLVFNSDLGRLFVDVRHVNGDKDSVGALRPSNDRSQSHDVVMKYEIREGSRSSGGKVTSVVNLCDDGWMDAGWVVGCFAWVGLCLWLLGFGCVLFGCLAVGLLSFRWVERDKITSSESIYICKTGISYGRFAKGL
jgi:hypothetical protein